MTRDEIVALIVAGIRQIGGRVHDVQTDDGLYAIRFELPDGLTREQFLVPFLTAVSTEEAAGASADEALEMGS